MLFQTYGVQASKTVILDLCRPCYDGSLGPMDSPASLRVSDAAVRALDCMIVFAPPATP
jgi:hypothetical protein